MRVRAERIQRILFHLLLLTAAGLLAWLAYQHAHYWDWTENRRNSLSAESLALIQRLEAPLTLTSFAPDNPSLRKRIASLLERYRRERPAVMDIQFVDPERHPDRARAAGIELAGELLLEYQGRSERLQTLSEGHISNALQRLLGRPDRWIGALGGHGERDLTGNANHHLGRFGQALEARGYRIQSLDLAQTPVIPDNLGMLVIAGPQRSLLPAEVGQISAYVERGGNLLWLTDPDDASGLDGLAEALDIEMLPGRVVDTNVRELGVDDPTVALVSGYPAFGPVRGFKLMSLFPGAVALQSRFGERWIATDVLRTQPRSWNETGPVQGRVERNAELGEKAGPLTLGVALEGQSNQRVLVIGDGDFLSNAFLDNAGNRELGLRLVRWLMEEDKLLDIPSPPTGDRELAITRGMALWLGVGSLLLMPLGFLLTGLLIHRRRNRD